MRYTSGLARWPAGVLVAGPPWPNSARVPRCAQKRTATFPCVRCARSAAATDYAPGQIRLPPRNATPAKTKMPGSETPAPDGLPPLRAAPPLSAHSMDRPPALGGGWPPAFQIAASPGAPADRPARPAPAARPEPRLHRPPWPARQARTRNLPAGKRAHFQVPSAPQGRVANARPAWPPAVWHSRPAAPRKEKPPPQRGLQASASARSSNRSGKRKHFGQAHDVGDQ